jgi:hypothetical protein
MAASRADPDIPRNAPCPCGSGRKYKHCHLAGDEAKRRDGRERPAVHEIDERLVADMQRYAARRFSGIWQATLDVFEDLEQEVQLASPWSVYGATVDGRAVVDWYLIEKGRYLSAEERGWLGAQQRSWLTIWEVTDVEAGKSVSVHDLLTGEDRNVHEVKGSRVLVRRDAVLGRVVDHDGISVFCGLYPSQLSPLDAAEVVRTVRAKLRRKTPPPPQRLRDEAIARFMIAQWQDAVATMTLRAHVPPRLANLDGDELLLTTDVFGFPPARRAEVGWRLKTVEGVEQPEEDESTLVFLRGARSARETDDRTVLGTATLGTGELRVETNSVERADALRSRVEMACQGLIVHERRDHPDPLAPRIVRSSDDPVEVEESASAREVARAFKHRHYQEWADHPLPALNGKTPREAIRTASGRSVVETLLKHFENHEEHAPPDVRFDFNSIRRELGLPL